MDSLLGKLSASFFMAAFVPALGFVALAAILFEPMVPASVKTHLSGLFDIGEWNIMLTLILAIILGFTLSSLNTFIYKTLEGYRLLQNFKSLQRRQQRRAQLIQWRLKRLDREIDRANRSLLRAPAGSARREKWMQLQAELLAQHYQLTAEYDQTFPPLRTLILPTRFGNMFRAAEAYPAYRYGIDGVPIWPRLVSVMSKGFYNRLEENNNGLAFLANCATLSLFIAVLCVFASLYQLWLGYCTANNLIPIPYFIQIDAEAYIYGQRALLYLLIAPLMLALSYAFYEAALPVLRRYGNLVRTSYDLFRFDLLDALHFEKPKDMDDEETTWQSVGELIAVGKAYHGRPQLNLDYQFDGTSSVGDGDSNDDASD